MRDLKREEGVRAKLRNGGAAEPGADLSFFAADLGGDAGWREAIDGCEYVLHVASPLPVDAPKHEDDLIVPAREGTLRVLRAARDARVRRVVLTSSCGAIYYGHPPQKEPFTEESWTNLDGEMSSYVKSKAIAERAAWDFVDKEGGGLELCAITDLHLRAMTNPAARGERFIAVSGNCMSMLDIAKVLKGRMGAAGRKAPGLQLPNWLVRLAAKRNPALRQLVPMLGKIRDASSEKAIRLLGWTPRAKDEAIVATAESLVRFGLLKH